MKASYLGLAIRVKGALVSWEVIQPINLSAGKYCLNLYEWGGVSEWLVKASTLTSDN